MSGSNIVTLAFGKKRDTKLTLEQLPLLINRVIDEQYSGKWGPMLADFAAAQIEDNNLQLKDWLQEQLGAIQPPHRVSMP